MSSKAKCASAALALLLAACGGGGTDAGGDAGSDAAPPATTTPSFAVAPARAKVGVGESTLLFAPRAPAAVTWSSSNGAIATVDAAGNVQGIGRGSAVITATTSAGAASAAVGVFRTVGADRDPTSAKLIAAALAAGSIDAEQALLYRVWAAMGDARLPAAYDGAPDAAPDHMILRETSARMGSLSPATRDLLRPFFVPPIYAQSAFAQKPAGRGVAKGGDATRYATAVNCDATALALGWRKLSAGKFNVFYVDLGLGDSYSAENRALATAVAASVEGVYSAETGLLGRIAKSDAGLPCNGGDDGIDIYLGMAESRTVAQTVPYEGSCADTAGFIVLNSNNRLVHDIAARAVTGAGEVRDVLRQVLAHEVMHLLQMAMSRGGDCANLNWFDEATAEWAMDFVVPQIASSDAGEPGIEDGLTKVGLFSFAKRRSGQFLAEYLYTGHMRSLEDGLPDSFGYADYLFFQYLHRKHGNAAIKRIFDAMAGGAGDLEAIAGAVDMKAVWPEFALTLWNDVAGKVLDYWNTADKYDFGLWDVFAHSGSLLGAPTNLKPLEIDQKGQPRATFTLLDNALANSRSGAYEIPPRSMFYEHLKFTDATVSSVYLLNPIGANPNAEFMKVQVVMKIAGEWKPPEDWSREPFKQFCRDKKSERLEEILIVVSNSEVDRLNEKPFAIPKFFPMRISTSNVGCWKWQGTASYAATGTIPFPTTYGARADGMTFEAVSFLPGAIVFETTAGSISGSGRSDQGPCTITSAAATRAATRMPIPDGTIFANLDLDLGFGGLGGATDPVDRRFRTLSGLSTLVTTLTEICPSQTLTSTGPQSWDWLRVDDPAAYSVSADGRTIEGRFTSAVLGTTVNSTWRFTALRD